MAGFQMTNRSQIPDHRLTVSRLAVIFARFSLFAPGFGFLGTSWMGALGGF